MKIAPFKTEEYFGKYEFSQPHMLSASDCETVSIQELLRLGGGSLNELSELTLGYTELQGGADLRKSIAEEYASVDPDDVIVLGSPIEGIFLTAQVLLNPDQRVIVLTPAYDSLIHSMEFACQQVSHWKLLENGDEWALDFKSLKELITKETEAIVVNFPHNPTGFQPSPREFKELIDIAKENDLWVFCDEIYRGLEYQPEDQLPSMADCYPKSVVLNGLSKSLGLPGLRLGWLTIKDPKTRKTLMNWKNYTSMCVSKTSEYLGHVALRASSSLQEKNRQIIQKNIQLTSEFMNRQSNLYRWIKPQAGSVSVFEVLGETSAEAYCAHLAQEHGLVLLPTTFMGLEDRYARVGLGRSSYPEKLKVWETRVSK